MSKHVTISPTEAADRLAIRDLVEAYPHCEDRRDAKGQMALFTEDTHFVVYMDAKDPKPTQELHGRDSLAPVFGDLNKYDATTHFARSSVCSSIVLRPEKAQYCFGRGWPSQRRMKDSIRCPSPPARTTAHLFLETIAPVIFFS